MLGKLADYFALYRKLERIERDEAMYVSMLKVCEGNAAEPFVRHELEYCSKEKAGILMKELQRNKLFKEYYLSGSGNFFGERIEGGMAIDILENMGELIESKPQNNEMFQRDMKRVLGTRNQTKRARVLDEKKEEYISAINSRYAIVIIDVPEDPAEDWVIEPIDSKDLTA